MPAHKIPFETRFWSKVEKTETCWNWTASTSTPGYGQIQREGKSLIAHRVAYEMNVGPIPTGLYIDHMCHNRACVNPEHLRLATGKQNRENHNGPSSNSKSGIRGVYPFRNKWMGRVMHNGKNIYVGVFDSLDEAEAAVVAKRLELHTYNDFDRQQQTKRSGK